MSKGTIKKVAGPLVIASGMRDANMFDVVRVSDERLIGEIIEIHGDEASIQVYEETSGLGPGEPVESMDVPLSVELGPGLLTSIYDGIQRPLDDIMKETGSNNLKRGVEVPSLKRDKKWQFVPTVKAGDSVEAGDIIGTVQETLIIEHKIMVPYGVKGTVKEIKSGEFTVEETVAVIETENREKKLTMMQKWPVRRGRPYQTKLPPVKPLITGQRVVDAFFPIAKGGVAAVPGPFGSGKTVIQHQLAKWAEADIVVYIGCGERGNEMTDVLNEFPELKDPKTGHSLMQRTVLIANTSDMPVAAREASIYTGITIAEYFRDMGYSVALMADSTSRWAEALREMSGRLEEMPGEEGYPAYLGSRLAQFYERAGHVICLGRDGREARCPQSEPYPRQAAIFRAGFPGDAAYRQGILGTRFSAGIQAPFPAINWLTSYSLYVDNLGKWFDENVSDEWMSCRQGLMSLLQEEAELEEIVKMVGMDALSPSDRLKMEAARSIREDFLHQNSFHEIDTYTPLQKQFRMMKLVLAFYEQSKKALEGGASIQNLIKMPVREQIGRFKYTKAEDVEKEYQAVLDELAKEVADAAGKGAF